MERCLSCEADWFSASQEIPRMLWKPKVHYRVYNSPPTVPILRQTTLFHAPHSTLRRFILIISCHVRLGLTSGLFPSGFPTKTLYTPIISPMRTTCPAYLILLDLINRTIFGEEYRSLSSSLCSFLRSPFTSSLYIGPV